MGRDTTADMTPLLKNAEQNIGNSATILPQSGAATVIPQTNPARILDLSGGSGVGQTTSVIFTATRILKGAQNPNPGYAGPITGILEFGNGGRFTRAEFDVPIGPYAGTAISASSAIEPQDGGVIVSVPTGLIRAYMRYDNLLIAPVLGSNPAIPPQSLAQILAVPFTGPGGPVTSPLPPFPVTPAEPVAGKAMAAYFSRHRSKVYKTLFLYVDNFGLNPVGFSTSLWVLPAFARSVKVIRLPLTAALDITLYDNVHQLDGFAVASGTSAPEVDLLGQENIIGIASHDPNTDKVTYLAVICEIGI